MIVNDGLECLEEQADEEPGYDGSTIDPGSGYDGYPWPE